MPTADRTPSPGAQRRPTPVAPPDVPDADAQEQDRPVGDWAGDSDDGGVGFVPDETPEADVVEQEQVVAPEQVRTPVPRPDDASEADWLDQTIAEPVDEDER